MRIVRVIIFSISIVGVHFLRAQQVDYNKVILPDNIKVTAIEEKLVQLAWQNMPINSILKSNEEIADLRHKQAKWSWLNNLAVRGNLNEFSIDPESSPTGVNLFPRYNVGVVIPLGIFVSTPLETKMARKELENSQRQTNAQKLLVRKQVLSAYYNYRMYEEIVKIKSDQVEDEYTSLVTIEEKFQRREITLEQYRTVTRSYNAELEEKLKAQFQLQNAKLELEALIGLKLEDVL